MTSQQYTRPVNLMPNEHQHGMTPLHKRIFRAYASGQFAEIAVEGIVRQGKTAAMCHCLVDQVVDNMQRNPLNPQFNQFGALAESQAKAVQNLGPYIEDLCDQYEVSCEQKGGNAQQAPHWLIGGVSKVYQYGGHNVRALGQIRGVTLHSAIVDEITLVDRLAFETLEERRSFDGGWVMTTCNPDRPNHWYRQRVVNARPEARVHHISVRKNQNPHYSEEMWNALWGRNPASAAFRRNVLGEWVADQGVVFPLEKHNFIDWDYRKDSSNRLGHIVVDEGLRGKQAALLFLPFGKNREGKDRWIVADEHMVDAQMDGTHDAEWHVRRLIDRWGHPLSWICDPAAGAFKDAAVKHSRSPVVNAHADTHDLLKTIDRTNEALFAGRLVLADNLPLLRGSCDGYTWDEKAERPRKDLDNSHFPDCMRYGCSTLFPFGGLFG